MPTTMLVDGTGMGRQLNQVLQTGPAIPNIALLPVKGIIVNWQAPPFSSQGVFFLGVLFLNF
jgi:hypothetical protein